MTEVENFAGSWIYRSFVNNTELEAEADDVLLARGGLKLEVGDTSSELYADAREITGRLSFGDLYLTISGTVEPSDPPTIRFRGTGVEDTWTAGWIYDYVGYLAPIWPNGKGQQPTIVGTVIRTVDHKASGGGISPAGYTLSFIAVSSDQPS
ncbi:MAG: hypothetical protein ACRDTG_22645 [Pseudonocardiaceae bacterium]